jgi:3-deoxy-D-manno-octulosonic acid kinase
METQAADIERLQPFRDAHGRGEIVFDPTLLRQAETSLFVPAHYGANAQPVGDQGGRGAAWFVRGEFGEGVLRHYRRGGWMARLSEDTYLWRGRAQVRSLREFALLRNMRAAGLPVPTPLAAAYSRSGISYRADLLMQRIPEVESFLDLVRSRQALAPWREVGATIARFHRHGLHHADLNAHNLLVDSNNKVFLIDWDKGRAESAPGPWCDRVLERLQRSLRKWLPDVSGDTIAAGMRDLRAAHEKGLKS